MPEPTHSVKEVASAKFTARNIDGRRPSGEPDAGLIIAGTYASVSVDAFVKAVARHRHPERETDPPRV